MDINDRNIKSYSNEDNLAKALKKHGIDGHRHLVVWNREGRCTAVFFGSNFELYGISYIGFYGQFGFMVVG